MKLFKTMIVFFIVAGILLVIGGIAMGASFGDITTLITNDEDYQLVDPYTYQETIQTLEVDVTTRNVVIVPSEDDSISVSYYEKEDDIWSVTLVDHVLKVTLDEEFTINHWFSWSFASREVLTLTISIPASQSFDIDAMTNTGDIIVNHFLNVGDLNLKTDTGRIDIEDIDAASATLDTATGSVHYDLGHIDTKLSIDTNTGSVYITSVEVYQIDVNVDTGSIYLNQVDASKIDLKSNTGSIYTTDLDLTNRTLKLQTDTGTVKVNNLSEGNEYNLVLTDSNYYLNATTDTGSINIS